jgi:hypothetical protein
MDGGWRRKLHSGALRGTRLIPPAGAHGIHSLV